MAVLKANKNQLSRNQIAARINSIKQNIKFGPPKDRLIPFTVGTVEQKVVLRFETVIQARVGMEIIENTFDDVVATQLENNSSEYIIEEIGDLKNPTPEEAPAG